MQIKVLGLIGLSILVSTPLSAHEVSATQVKVFQQKDSLEVWQTTPYKVAHGIVSDQSTESSSEAGMDQEALKAISEAWVVKSVKGECKVTKQAYRRVHHDTQLQFRILFRCPEGTSARFVSMNWLKETPIDHFVFYDKDTEQGTKRRIIQRDQVSFTIDQ